ncbi:MAG TPA: hypothetical protein VMZ69_05030 [Saprospiraceae bacterium]|nr:hypothetical protein [Saprospiraceae bacterium]
MPGPNPIIIRNVSHLTDARYFAAMEVDWISIALTDDPVSFSRWHAMREWISGVKLAAELATAEESLVAKTIIDANPEGIITDNIDIIHLTGGMALFILTEKILQENENFAQIISYVNYNKDNGFLFSNPEAIYLDANWTREMIFDLKQKNYNGGICLHASGELAAGMKDFSEMDEILELIRN